MKNIKLLVKQAKMFLSVAQSSLPHDVIYNMLFGDSFHFEYELLYSALTSEVDDDALDYIISEVELCLPKWEYILEQSKEPEPNEGE